MIGKRRCVQRKVLRSTRNAGRWFWRTAEATAREEEDDEMQSKRRNDDEPSSAIAVEVVPVESFCDFLL